MRKSLIQIRNSALLVALLFFSIVTPAVAGELDSLRGSALPIPRGLEDRILFWVDIFAKYGENNSVVHHRDYPEIVYSVLDFTQLRKEVGDNRFRAAREPFIDQEREKVRQSLLALAAGGKADTPLKKRIVQIYGETIGASRANYRAAASDIELIRSQTGIKERFAFGVARSFRYIHIMEEIFRQEGLPPELTRLPLIESSFNYEARSTVGAAGVWQFMPATGKVYMRVDNYIDERLDPVIASRSAAKYLSDAYRRLETWPLAVTSYNHGVAGMGRAVRETGTRDFSIIVERYKGKAFGFASKNFYVELLAAIEVHKNWRKYFPDLVPEPPVYFDEVKLRQAISFPRLLQISGVDKAELQRLNLGFKDPVIQGRANIPAGYVLKTPRNSGNAILAKLGSGSVLSIADSKPRSTAPARQAVASGDWNGQYRVQKGESLGKIAERFDVAQAQLLEANNLQDANRIRAGQLLKVPAKSSTTQPTRLASKRVDSSSNRYRVQSGDTVGKIAQQFGVSSSELMRVNGIGNPRNLKAGQTVTIPRAAPAEVQVAAAEISDQASSSSGVYRVKKGDTLHSIARQLGVSVTELKARNSGLRDIIHPGQSLSY